MHDSGVSERMSRPINATRHNGPTSPISRHTYRTTEQMKTKSQQAKISTSTRASARVFAITEILEQILLHVPSRDQNVFQRVSRLWRATIKGVYLIRRSLFRESINLPDAPATGNCVVYLEKWQEFEFLMERCGLHRNMPSYSYSRTPSNVLNGSVVFPSFSKLACINNVPLKVVDCWNLIGASKSCRVGSEGEWCWSRLLSNASTYGAESWRAMFLSQPPCQQVNIWSIRQRARSMTGQTLEARLGSTTSTRQ